MVFDKTLTTTKKRVGKNEKLFIVVHHTAVPDYEASCRVLSGPPGGRPVSVHYVVGDKGQIAKIGQHEDILWHVGNSKWQNRTDLNKCAIGIEIASDGYSYTEEQKNATAELIRYIITTEKIPAENVLRHADVSGYRGKWDVGPAFFAPLTWKQYQDQFRPPQPSDWAKVAWQKALTHNPPVVTKDPRGDVIAPDLELMLFRLGLLKETTGTLSRERLMVVFDKLALL